MACPCFSLEIYTHSYCAVGFVEPYSVADNLKQYLVVDAPVCIERFHGHLSHAYAYVQVFKLDALAKLNHKLLNMVFDALGLFRHLLEVEHYRFVLDVPGRKLRLLQVGNVHCVAPNTAQIVLIARKNSTCPTSNILCFAVQEFYLVGQRIRRMTKIDYCCS